MKNKHFVLALCSALVIGLGQILKGDSEKGIKFILTFYVALPAILYITLSFSGSIFLILFGVSIIFSFIFWAVNVLDAAR